MDNTWVVGGFILTVVLASADILRRTINEFLRLRSQKEIAKIMRRLRRPVQPWVTVIVFGKKNEAALAATLRSVRRSHYYAYDISIVGPRARTYQTAYRNSRRGKIVICLPAGIEIDAAFIKRAVALGNERRQWETPVYKSQKQVTLGITGIVNCLMNLLWNKPVMIEVCTAAALRPKKIPALQTFQGSKIIPPVTQLVGIGLLALGIIYGDLTVLWWAWLLLTGYLLALVWLQEITDWKERWQLSFSIPSALFLVPVASIVVGISQVSTRK